MDLDDDLSVDSMGSVDCSLRTMSSLHRYIPFNRRVISYL